jgi:hypothetical protein
MSDVRSQIVERTDRGGRLRARLWIVVCVAAVAGLVAGFAIGSERGVSRADLDAATERAERAERIVIRLRGERDRLNGQIKDNHVVIANLEARPASGQR